MASPRPSTSIIAAALVVLSLALVPAAARAQDSGTLSEAIDLIQSRRYDEAIELVQAFAKDHPEEGRSWALLANAYHSKGDYETAIEMNRKAAEFPGLRVSALYNEACAHSLLGNVDAAQRALESAVEEGFLDFDLMATDSDLDNLREKHDIPMPPQHEYVMLKARNGVELGYKILLPKDYDSAETYPAVVVFAPGPGKRSVDWALSELIGKGDDTRGWIVVYPVGPQRGWFTHPSHHALNDLLSRLKLGYKIEDDRFHLAGFGEGARVATTYSQMSRDYFQSLTVLSGWHWDRWGGDDLGEDFRSMPVRIVVGGKDALGRPMNEKIAKLMRDGGVDVKLSVVETDDHVLPSVRHGKLIEYLP